MALGDFEMLSSEFTFSLKKFCHEQRNYHKNGNGGVRDDGEGKF